MKALAGIVFPPQCAGCGQTVAEPGALCGPCWRGASFIGDACCPCCGVPVASGTPNDDTVNGEGPGGDAAICDDCLARPRPWGRARAALVYDGSGRRVVLALKHGDRPDLAPALGRWMADAAAPLVRPAMIVVPIPLHPLRLVRRKYNQAALLAAHVARRHGLALAPAALIRRRHTPMQDHRSAAERFSNLDGAMAVPARSAGMIAGRAVLLVDDVMASGATMSAAATALLSAGAASVDVLVLARAVRGDSPAAEQDW